MEVALGASALAFTRAPVAMAVLRGGRVVEANDAYAARFGFAPVADAALTPIGDGLVLATVREDPTVRWLRSIVDNSAALVYVKDLDGRYLFVNRHFERHFGLAADEILGRCDFDLFPPELAEAYVAHDRRVLASRAALEVEEPAERDAHWLSVKFPLTDERGAVYALGGISTDITDRRRAREAAERANRAKSEFLSRMSHELRTPLNAILGFAQLLALEPLPEPAQASTARIAHAGRHLVALIDEVLELARVEAGALPFTVEPVHAPEPLAEALELVRPLARERGIAVSADLHGGMHRHCAADRRRLVQALLNLLANAVKYNRPDGVVRVSLRVDGEALRYLVTDTGPGLDAEARVRAFQPFERLGAEASGVEGSGLGLVLSRSLVEGMGGRLGIQHSAPGEGSTFFVELPLAAAPAFAPPPAAREVAWDLPPVKVLCVEDHPANLELVRMILARMPAVELIPARHGGPALELAARHRPDVILLDLHLPDVPGLAVLGRLRADPRTRAIPVVVLSADATPATMERVSAHGVAGYVTKPLDVAAFVGVLRTAVGA